MHDEEVKIPVKMGGSLPAVAYCATCKDKKENYKPLVVEEEHRGKPFRCPNDNIDSNVPPHLSRVVSGNVGKRWLRIERGIRNYELLYSPWRLNNHWGLWKPIDPWTHETKMEDPGTFWPSIRFLFLLIISAIIFHDTGFLWLVPENYLNLFSVFLFALAVCVVGNALGFQRGSSLRPLPRRECAVMIIFLAAFVVTALIYPFLMFVGVKWLLGVVTSYLVLDIFLGHTSNMIVRRIPAHVVRSMMHLFFSFLSVIAAWATFYGLASSGYRLKVPGGDLELDWFRALYLSGVAMLSFGSDINLKWDSGSRLVQLLIFLEHLFGLYFLVVLVAILIGWVNNPAYQEPLDWNDVVTSHCRRKSQATRC